MVSSADQIGKSKDRKKFIVFNNMSNFIGNCTLTHGELVWLIYMCNGILQSFDSTKNSEELNFNCHNER
jgi:hypothetical protein